jgi:hypothetical protein
VQAPSGDPRLGGPCERGGPCCSGRLAGPRNGACRGSPAKPCFLPHRVGLLHRAGGEEAAPGEAEAEVAQAQAAHERDVAGVAVVEVAGGVAGVALVGLAWGVAEGVPDGGAPPALCGSALQRSGAR